MAEPLDACSSLLNKVIPGQGASSPFVLIIRGGCTFNDKVRSAQHAGFKAVIVFDDEDGSLVASNVPFFVNFLLYFVECLQLFAYMSSCRY